MIVAGILKILRYWPIAIVLLANIVSIGGVYWRLALYRGWIHVGDRILPSIAMGTVILGIIAVVSSRDKPSRFVVCVLAITAMVIAVFVPTVFPARSAH
jgi:hypothetical protein